MCKITDTQIQQDGASVASAIQNIAAVLAADGDTTLAAQLSAAANALLAVTSNWGSGSVLADFNTAAQAVEAVLALIPTTSVLVPFIEIAIAALDILIANIGGSSTSSEITIESVKEMQAKIALLPPNPYRGKVTIERKHFQSPRTAFKNAWNAEVDKEPTLGIVKLA